MEDGPVRRVRGGSGASGQAGGGRGGERIEDGSLAVLNDNDFSLTGELDTTTGEVGVVEPTSPTVLGFITFDDNNGLDASDRDSAINIQNWPIHSMYMPDAVASFAVDGETFYITANEGDARDEEARIKDLELDPDAFPNAAELQADENLVVSA